MASCPDKNSKEFKEMVEALGEDLTYYLWNENKGNPLYLAPNGNESKLYNSLLELHDGNVNKALQDKAKVYSKEFKEWFGDWLNEDKTDVSKVVDENDEPLIVYHGSENKFNTFYSKSHFGSKKAALTILDEKVVPFNGETYKEYLNKYNLSLYPVFLNIKNIKLTKDLGNSNEWLKKIENLKNKKDGIEYINQIEDKGIKSFIAFNPNQIKSVISPTQQQIDEFGLEEDKIGLFNKKENNIYYQNNTNQSNEEYIASEKTIRDIAERMADRIGIKVKYISDRTKSYKGKLKGDTAIINLAHATLDTPIHEILGHPIINAIKHESGKREEFFEGKVNKFTSLYNNLLKELEYGKGKKVLDRVKEDYNLKLDMSDILRELNRLAFKSHSKLSNLKDIDGITIVNNKYKEAKLINNEIFIHYKGESYNRVEIYEAPLYTLEEQQEEAIVQLLGEYTANRLNKVKDGKLISLLKRLLKEMKSFIRSLFNKKEIKVEELPDNMTLKDLADLLAYSNSKLILPGNEVVYTTPDNQKFKTYKEASNHISKLIKLNEIELDKIDINTNTLPEQFDTVEGLVYKEGKDFYIIYDEEVLDDEQITVIDFKRTHKKISKEHALKLYKQLSDYIRNDINDFIEKNKEFEQSKQIVDEWKEINKIKYNPEEIYSRGQGFYSVIGAYSDFDVELMLQNLLTHIEDNKKAGGEFTISAFTRDINKKLNHLEGGGGKIRFKIFPKSEDIKWAANTDVYSGSVWDASEKINKDKKSEIIGVSYTKAPSLNSLSSIQPNLANMVDNIAHHHNELGIELTTDNFRLEYDVDIPYSTKKIIDTINNILDEKYGELKKPKITNLFLKPFKLKTNLKIQIEEINPYGEIYSHINKPFLFHGKVFEVNDKKFRFQYNKDLQIFHLYEIEYINGILLTNKRQLKTTEAKVLGITPDIVKYEKNKILKEINKQYNNQALINTKIAALKEGMRKYPRSLIRSKVVTPNIKNTNTYYQKVSNSINPEESKAYLSKAESLFDNSLVSLTHSEGAGRSTTLISDILDIEDEVEMNPKIQKAIDELNNRIKSLELGIKKASNEEEILERIDRLKERKAILLKEMMLTDIVDIARESLEWVRSKILTKDEIYANDVMLADQELSTIKILLNDLLEYDKIDSKTGKPIYTVNNKLLLEMAEEVKKDINVLDNRILDLKYLQLQNLAKSKYGDKLELADIKGIKDVGFIGARTLDASRVESKVVKMLNGVLVDVDKNVMNEFDIEVSKRMEELSKETGLDFTKEAVQDRFRQKDKDGNYTGNYVHEFSQEYFDWVYNLTFQLGALTGKDLTTRQENKKIKLFTELTNNVVMPNFDKLFTEKATTESKQEERDRLVGLIGETATSRLLKYAESRYERYIKAKESYRAALQEKGDAGNTDLDTEEKIDKAVFTWVSYKHPSNIYKRLVKGEFSKVDIRDVKRFLPYAPLKEVEGRKTKWYDKDFKFIRENQSTYGKVYDFLMEEMDKYKAQLPPQVSNKLQENFMPELTKDILSEIIRTRSVGAITGANLVQGFFNSISTPIRDTDFTLRDSRQQPIKSVPIRYVSDVAGRLKKQINKIENTIKAQESILANLKIYEGNTSPEEIKKIKEGITENLKELKKERDSLINAHKKAFKNKSLDPFATFKAFAMMSINYKRKSAVEDIINIGQQALSEADEIAVNSVGNKIKDRAGKFINVDKGKLNVSKQFDYAVNSIMYGKYKENKGGLNMAVGGTPESKEKLKNLNKLIKENKAQFYDGKISAVEFEETEAQLKAQRLELEDVRTISANKIVDQFIKLTYQTSLGWKPLSAAANVLYGLMANSIEGGSGKYFTNTEYRRAVKLMLSTTKKSLTTIEDKIARKIKNLMGNYAIMFDLLEDAYGSGKSLDEFQKKLGLLNPMEMFKRGEYFNQASLLVAMLLHKKVKTVKGKEISLWEVYDENGKFKEDIENKEEWQPTYDAMKGNEFTRFRNRAVQLVKRTHGNYDPSSPLWMKETALGRALSLFKTWSFEGIATRIEKTEYDYQLGDMVEGRYRTAKELGFYGSIKTLKNILMVNYIKSKKKEDLNLDTELAQLRFDNMARNLKEIQWMLTLMSIYLLANMAFDDDDKKTDGYKLFADLLARLQGDVTMYVTPQGITDLYKNPVPIIRTLDQIAEMPEALYYFITKDDKQHDMHYLMKNLTDPIPGINIIF